MRKSIGLLAIIALFVASTALASSTGLYNGHGKSGKSNGGVRAPSTVTVLTFEGIPDSTSIGSFYAGQGIYFGSSSLALVEDDAGGNGNFINEPSYKTIAFFLSPPGDIMNVPAGFTTGFSFFYTSAYSGSVTVWSGPSATGSLLASLALSANDVGQGCDGSPAHDDYYCAWSAIGVNFSGVAESVNFSGTANQIGFDNITLGSSNPGTPEPGTLVLFGSGLLGLGGVIRRRLGR
jgi:hypothetical protein